MRGCVCVPCGSVHAPACARGRPCVGVRPRARALRPLQPLQALGFHILSENAAGSALKINLKGILIGDGLVDPYHQYPSYVKFARAHQAEMKVSAKELGLMEAALVPCEPLIKACGSWNLTCQACDGRRPSRPPGTAHIRPPQCTSARD
jgi:hypothetical protein